jgi:hypothetical protein
VHDIGERRGLEIPLPDLEEVDAGPDRMAGLLDQAPAGGAAVARGAGKPPAIRDKLQDQGLTCESAGGSNRPEKTGASSERPTRRFMIPRPVTPPRTNGLSTNGLSSGQLCAK